MIILHVTTIIVMTDGFLSYSNVKPCQAHTGASSSSIQPYNSRDYYISSFSGSLPSSLYMVNHQFNPFTQRQKNRNIKWFESDLNKFYKFIESKPLLTAEQEVWHGKAVSLWITIEKERENLRLAKVENLQNGTNADNDDSSTYDLLDNLVTIAPNAPPNAASTTTATTTRREVKEEDCASPYSYIYITNKELAKHLECSEITIEKIERYGELSKAKLVDSNLKLVLAVVSRYRSSNIPNSELIAEGTIGLSKAALRYDYSKGFRFATYATWYVHQSISEYVRWRKHPAKMPSRYLILLRIVKKFSKEFKKVAKRAPTVAEIVQETGHSHYDVVKVLNMQQYPSLLFSPVATGTGAKDGKERTYEDMLPSQFKEPLECCEIQDNRRDLENLMATNLNDVERDVLRLRLGLDDGEVKAIKEVGKRFKISWKQVLNVEKEAVEKLLASDDIEDFAKRILIPQ